MACLPLRELQRFAPHTTPFGDLVETVNILHAETPKPVKTGRRHCASGDPIISIATSFPRHPLTATGIDKSFCILDQLSDARFLLSSLAVPKRCLIQERLLPNLRAQGGRSDNHSPRPLPSTSLKKFSSLCWSKGLP